MVTTVNKTIQAAGGDYTTYALAISGLPSSLVTADEQWNFKADGTFSFSTGLSVTVTTDSTRFVDFDCQTSKGFASAASPVGRWDSSKGLNLACTGYAQTAWTFSTDTFKLHNHQVAQTGGGNRRALVSTSGGSSNSLIESSIFESGDAGPDTRYGTFRNCLSIVRGNNSNEGWNFDYYVGGTVACITVARPTTYTPAGSGFKSDSAITMKDCVSVGFTAFKSGGGTFSGSNNGTDLSSVGFGTSNQVSVAFSTATFVGVTDAARDFRIVTGAALKDTGVTDTTTIPAAVDAYGTSRPQGSAWDIGFHEFVSAVAGSPFFQTDWANPAARASVAAAIAIAMGSPSLLTMLAGTDALPFRQATWPVPPGKLPVTQTQPFGTLATLFNVSFVQPPINQYNWPNPTLSLKRFDTQPIGTPNLLNFLAGQDALPFRKAEWPNPPGALPRTQTQTLGRLSALFPIVAAPPFFQVDWPNPVLRIPAVNTQPVGSPLKLTTLAGADRIGPRQSDWPNPVLRLSRFNTQPLGIPSFYIPVVVPPTPPLTFSGYTVRNYTLRCDGIIVRSLSSSGYRDRILKGPSLPSRRLLN